MKLSRKKAIELCISLWTWCAKTGREKEDWPNWKKYGNDIQGDCWFCEYDKQFKDSCITCPLVKKLKMHCSDEDCFFNNWCAAKTPKTRKKYAKLFLAQIKKCK